MTDGTAVLGLGDIGPAAALPVMEGKALLFKNFAAVDAFPICIDVGGRDTPVADRVQAIVETVQRIAPVFGGINLEDIAAPQCFEVEERLRSSLDIPVFHDDQHGTAVVALAALENALKLVDKKMGDLRVVIIGAGAAGVAIAQILANAGVGNIVGADRQGAIHLGRTNLNEAKRRFAEVTNPEQLKGSLSDVLPGADVFIGVSGPGLLVADDLRKMASSRSCSPWPTRSRRSGPRTAKGLVAVMATGRSDFPNQINNVLAFPGIFRGALDAGATTITEHMKVAAAEAIAASVPTARTASRQHRAVGVRHVGRNTSGRGGCRERRGRRRLPAPSLRRAVPGPPVAVTFDFWNTLIREDSGALDRRVDAWLGLLEGEGVALERERVGEAFAASWKTFQEHWKANRVYGAPDAVSEVLGHLGLDATRRVARSAGRGVDRPATGARPAADRQHRELPGAAEGGRRAHRDHLRCGSHPVPHAAPLPRWTRPASLLRSLVVLRRGRHVQAGSGDLPPRPRRLGHR